jgi:hypothetical protein
MTNPNDILLLQTLGRATEQLEASLAPYYTSLEPWQRGLLLITLTLFLLFSIYYLTKSEKVTNLDTKKEKEIEERLMRQMAFFKKLKE